MWIVIEQAWLVLIPVDTRSQASSAIWYVGKFYIGGSDCLVKCQGSTLARKLLQAEESMLSSGGALH